MARKTRFDRIGEKRVMNCGDEAEIIAYRKASDIDVRFSTGAVCTHRIYQEFVNGNIMNPDNTVCVRGQRPLRSRIGEVRHMRSGMKVTIIAYRNCDDIDVQWEDGLIRQHCSYNSFCRGLIAHPAVSRGSRAKNERVGEKRVMRCQRTAEIIAYRKAVDIDVRWDDGVVVQHTDYRRFKRGDLAYPKTRMLHSNNKPMKGSVKVDHTGESSVMNCGLAVEIIEFHNSMDITVQFENGIIVPHRQYSEFKRGVIQCPGQQQSLKRANAEKLIGSRQKMSCGLYATITAYRGYKDVDVLFDDGVLVEHVSYKKFLNGNVEHKGYGKMVSL